MIKIIITAILTIGLVQSVDAKQERSQKAKDDFKYLHPCQEQK
jgi:hypothetical protein